MVNKISEEKIQEKIEKGYLKSRIMFELVGKPKEHIENTLKKYLEDIETKEEDSVILSTEFGEAQEIEGGLFSTYCDAEVLVQNPSVLASFCYEYMPASIEIEEPTEMRITNQDYSNTFNDLLFRLHEVSLELKKNIGKLKFAENNTVKLIYNLVILSLKKEAKSIDEIYEDTMVDKAELEKFLERLVEMKRIVKQEDGKFFANVVSEKKKNE
ncbi:hypothetical protein JXM83_02865 [Candidatus Woesearchaeota archaeon]|nr:hypothetical protein [Candidatus Woesearchaeota archaeon]